jgi:hypothetical protein
MDLQPYTETTVIPSRTRYELAQFVIGQHATAPMRWRQLLIEAQDMAYKIRLAELDCEKKHIEIDRLLATGDEIDAIEAEEKKLGLILTERTLEGARLEFGWLQDIAEQVGPYTLEDIENDQPDYWSKRLNKQAGLEQLSTTQGISAGNLTSMELVGLLEIEEN